MIAQYESKCAQCSETIRVGESIEPSDLGNANGLTPWWQHEACPPGKLDLVREVCGVCFTEKSVAGSCMCEVDA